MQFHSFNPHAHEPNYEKQRYNPEILYKLMDLYAKLGLAEQITEMTIPAYGGDEEEYAMLRLRLKDGLRDDLYYSRYKKHIPDDYVQRGKKLEKAGLVSVSDNVVSLTTRGFLLSNSVTAKILWG